MASKISPTMFVQMYLRSYKAGHNYQQFAERLGISPKLAYARAYWLRKRGVRLPKLGGISGRSRLTRSDVMALNRLVAASGVQESAAKPAARRKAAKLAVA